MKKGVLFIALFVLTLGFVSAAEIENNIPIQIQTLDASGNVITGTFTFTINISNSATCTPVLYSNTSTRTTDARGIVSYNLENVNLAFDEQYWFCSYRDGVLKDTVKAARVPYAFRAKNVTLSGVDVDTNFALGIYNITASIGSFGVGLSVSGYKLNVLGNVNITGNVSIGNGIIGFNSSSSSYIYYNTTDWNAFGTGTGSSGNYFNQQLNTTSNVFFVSLNTANNFYANSTNVRIGTTSPTDKLVVGSDFATAHTATLVTIGDTSQNSGVLFGMNESYRGNIFWNYAGNYTQIGTKEAGTSYTSTMVLKGGNVGIGTTSPTIALSISGSTANEVGININNTNPVGYSVLRLATGNAQTSSGLDLHGFGSAWPTQGAYKTNGGNILSAGELTLAAGSANTNISFFTGGTADANERMRITGSGNVGIGTTGPVNKLDVSGGMAVGSYAGVNAAPSNGMIVSGAVGIGTTNIPGGGALLQVGNNALTVIPNTCAGGSNCVMVGTTSPGGGVANTAFTVQGYTWLQGPVGIGTNGGTAALLDVNGQIRQTGCLSGSLSADGGGRIICTSDERMKDIIGNSTYGLNEIMKITPIKFNLKNETYVHIGFSAQNVQKVLPEATPMQKDGYLGLDSNAIIAALVNAIKEQQGIIVSQNNTINSQQQEINLLKAQMKELCKDKKYSWC